MSLKKIWLLIIPLMGLYACEKNISEAQLNQLYQETVAENQKLSELYAVTNKQKQWQLTIEGQTDQNKTYHFSWEELDRLAKIHVPTQEPHPGKPTTIFDFRGIRVSELLDLAKIAPQVAEITFVADDAYRVAVKVEDLRKYDIILAIERDGKPIPRSEGGPVYLVFPNTQFPELKTKYPATTWAFYVTHLIFGEQVLNLKVSNNIINETDFEKLPQTIVENSVGYRMFWPNGKVKLQGVLLQELLKNQGFALTDSTQILLKGKANVNRDETKPIILTGKELQSCNVILASRWGDQLAEIPAKMGGPLTLAFDSTCAEKWQKTLPWITFIEEIEIKS